MVVGRSLWSLIFVSADVFAASRTLVENDSELVGAQLRCLYLLRMFINTQPLQVSKKKADGFMGNLEDFAEDLLPEHEAPGPVKLRPKGWIQEETVDVGDFDPLRDGPLRYLGYANELG